jgi:Protein of unknown function (DUF3667)
VPGRYCGFCGQRLEPPVHSLWHFIQLAAEDLTHADSRLWRTLAALLFKPGYLTREFLHGRRASHLPPVRLYLVLSVVFFIWVGIGHPQRPAAPTAPREADGRVVTPFSPAQPGESEEQRIERLCSNWDYHGPWQERLGPMMPRLCRQVVADRGRALRETYLHNLPRAMFLFLPLLAAGMMLLYWWPRHFYVEHLLLLVHNHAFVFLIVPLVWTVSALIPVGGSSLQFATVLYIVYYMYRSMRMTYGQARALTAVKLVVLSFFYLVSGAVMAGLTVLYSVLTL